MMVRVVMPSRIFASMSTSHIPLTLDERLALADRMDDLIEDLDAGWSVPVMEGFFMGLAMLRTPPDVSVWLDEALPVQTLPEEERIALTADVMRLHADVHDFLMNEESEWMPLFVHTDSTDASFTALGFAQCLENFAPAEWKRFATDHKKSAAVIRTMADYALEGGRVSKAQFDAVEKKFMESVFEMLEANT